MGASLHHRRSIRLRDYDYTRSGAYFVTICAHERQPLFGQIVDGEMRLNDWGVIVQEEWAQTAVVRPNIELDAFVVMPNHIHGILVITDDVGATGSVALSDDDDDVRATRRVAPTESIRPNGPASGSLGAMIGQFKSLVTKRINAIRNTNTPAIWQRNYYEHIIRDEPSLNTIRAYVAANPAKWTEDSLYMQEL